MTDTYTGTITIYLADVLSTGFRTAMQEAVDRRDTVFSYADVEFHLDYASAGNWRSVRAVLRSTTAPLPGVFRRELFPQYTVLRADLPPRLHAKPGWYEGRHFNLPDAFCAVDPRGVHNDGKPRIYADGHVYGNVVALFALVMQGNLEPRTSF